MDQQLSPGIGIFNDGEFLRCHEVLEEAWRLARNMVTAGGAVRKNGARPQED